MKRSRSSCGRGAATPSTGSVTPMRPATPDMPTSRSAGSPIAPMRAGSLLPPLARPGGEPGLVAGEPAAESQPGRGEIAFEFLPADLIAPPRLRPDPAAGVVLHLGVHARRHPAGRADDHPDARNVIPGPGGPPERVEPARRILLEHRDAVALQVPAAGGQERAPQPV